MELSKGSLAIDNAAWNRLVEKKSREKAASLPADTASVTVDKTVLSNLDCPSARTESILVPWELFRVTREWRF